ncbi:MAG TPA: hypothetical protein VMB03_20585 [Bryobacteraceae bacterium]|nr:hypothetical protein [Bryobacteraceae bacterium]
MATMPEFLSRETLASMETREERQPKRDPFQLRALPFEDVYFRPKKMDNSKLVRSADPRAGGACWSVIGAACLMLAFGGGVLAPHVANTVAGYKLESLRAESQKLADERRTLELQEAELLSPERLDRLAQGQHLVTPSASQIVHLDNQGESKVAMVRH